MRLVMVLSVFLKVMVLSVFMKVMVFFVFMKVMVLSVFNTCETKFEIMNQSSV